MGDRETAKGSDLDRGLEVDRHLAARHRRGFERDADAPGEGGEGGSALGARPAGIHQQTA